MNRQERLDEIYRRLWALPPARSADEAIVQLREIMNVVEDELSGVAFDPSTMGRDGRLYPPQEDARRPSEIRSDARRYRTRGHNVFVEPDGSLVIQRVGASAPEFEKRGALADEEDA